MNCWPVAGLSDFEACGVAELYLIGNEMELYVYMYFWKFNQPTKKDENTLN